MCCVSMIDIMRVLNWIVIYKLYLVLCWMCLSINMCLCLMINCWIGLERGLILLFCCWFRFVVFLWFVLYYDFFYLFLGLNCVISLIIDFWFKIDICKERLVDWSYLLLVWSWCMICWVLNFLIFEGFVLIYLDV